jgi:hypothetical protein
MIVPGAENSEKSEAFTDVISDDADDDEMLDVTDDDIISKE